MKRFALFAVALACSMYAGVCSDWTTLGRAYAITLHKTPGNPWFTDRNCAKLVGDLAHDDTAALQACLTALPSFSSIVLPGKYLISDQILVDNKIDVSIGGVSRGDVSGSGLYWNGPGDDRCMLSLDHIANSKIHDLAFRVYTSTGVTAKCGISLRNSNAGRIFTTTNVAFVDNNIYGDSYTETPADFIAYWINPGGDYNIEHISFYDGSIYCAGDASKDNAKGIAIQLGGNFNQKGTHIERLGIGGCAKGVTGAISLSTIAMQVQSTTLAFEISPSDYCEIFDTDVENVKQFFVGGPCTLRQNRIGAGSPAAGHALIEVSNAGPVTVDGNTFYDQPTGSGMFKCSSSIGTIRLESNQYSDGHPFLTDTLWNAFLADLQTCGGGVQVHENWGFGTPALMMLGANNRLPGMSTDYTLLNFTPGFPGTGVLLFDRNGGGSGNPQWVMSSDAGRYRELDIHPRASAPTCTAAGDLGQVWMSNASTSVWQRCTKTGGSIGWVSF